MRKRGKRYEGGGGRREEKGVGKEEVRGVLLYSICYTRTHNRC